MGMPPRELEVLRVLPLQLVADVLEAVRLADWMFERSPSLLMGWRKKGKVTAKANLYVALRNICKSMCNFAFECYILRI